MNILVEFWFIILYSFFLSRSIITLTSVTVTIKLFWPLIKRTQIQRGNSNQHRNFFFVHVSPLEIKYSIGQNSVEIKETETAWLQENPGIEIRHLVRRRNWRSEEMKEEEENGICVVYVWFIEFVTSEENAEAKGCKMDN